MPSLQQNNGFDNPGFSSEIEDGHPTPRTSRDDSIAYSWHNVNVFAQEKSRCFDRKKKEDRQHTTKHILKDVSGICRPGELLAIMGASGAGKTTLLNVLTSRSSSKLQITGELYVNGTRITPSQLTSKSAYVQQEDLFIGTLTVKEMLHFQAMLRMDKDIPRKSRLARIEEVSVELGLVKCANTLIGIPGKIKGISGGETKRLAFACEVLTNPPIMFCDEPTTGLDSFMAENIVQSMRHLAEKGKTIISTIHQPSSQVFALFNRVLLMAEGRVAFLGETADALKFFESQGKICPRNFNPADFFISTLAIQPGREDACKEELSQICDHFRDSSDGISLLQAVHYNMKETEGRKFNTDESKAKQTYKANWGQQMIAVAKRSFTEVIREPMVLRIKLVQTIMTSLLLGIIFLGQDMNEEGGVNNINGALFLLLTNLSFGNIFGVINVFCMQLPIFLREHFNGMYRTDVYFIAKNLAEVPLAVTMPILFASIVYYMVGFNADVGRFFTCVAILVLVANIAVSFGYFVSCLASNLNMALAISAPLMIPFMLFGGFFLNSDSTPVYFIWLQYISWFNYGNEALMINQWKDVEDINCNFSTPVICYTSGNDIIESLGYNPDNLGFDFGMLVVLFFAFRILGLLLLLRKTYSKS